MCIQIYCISTDWDESSKMKQSVYSCHVIIRDCPNLCGATIPLKPHKSSSKSELIFLVGFRLPFKTQQVFSFESKRRRRLNIQFPTISSSCLNNYAGLLAQVFVLGILNAGWHLLWTVMVLEIFDLLFVMVWCSMFTAVQQHPLLIIYDMIGSLWVHVILINVSTLTKIDGHILRYYISISFITLFS